MQTLLRMKMKNEGNEGMPQNQNIQIIYKTTRLVEYDVYYIIYEPIVAHCLYRQSQSPGIKEMKMLIETIKANRSLQNGKIIRKTL